jgi:hypothetical protein
MIEACDAGCAAAWRVVTGLPGGSTNALSDLGGAVSLDRRERAHTLTEHFGFQLPLATTLSSTSAAIKVKA